MLFQLRSFCNSADGAKLRLLRTGDMEMVQAIDQRVGSVASSCSGRLLVLCLTNVELTQYGRLKRGVGMRIRVL